MANVELEPWLEANYRAVHEERGQSWAVMAAEMEPQDPKVAAWMRQQDAGESKRAERPAAEAPKRRGRPPKSDA